MGDTSDNIPGVKGIGEKTALTLVQNFGTLEGVYDHLDDKRHQAQAAGALAGDKPMAELSHTLGTIRTDAPIDTAEGAYTVGEGNKPPPCGFCRSWRFTPSSPVWAGRHSTGSRPRRTGRGAAGSRAFVPAR